MFEADPEATFQSLAQDPEGWVDWRAEFPTGFGISWFVVAELGFVWRFLGGGVAEVWVRLDKAVCKPALAS